MASFELGGAVIAFEAGEGNVRQTYEPKHPGTLLLLGSGSSVKQSLTGALNKLKTTIRSSNMWAAPALSALDYSGSLLLKCPQQRNIYGDTVSIPITPKRRSDTGYEPKGYGLVDGRMVETPLSIAADVATLDPVTGATSYMVMYWPQIYVFATFKESMNSTDATFGWELECQEI